MLTVRNLLPDGGEFVIEGLTVSVGNQPNPHRITSDSLEKLPVVYVQAADGEVVTLSEGDAYVMNSNGKTVAKYHMVWPVPMVEAISTK